MSKAVKLQPIEKPKANIEIYKLDYERTLTNFRNEKVTRKDIYYHASILPGYQLISFKRTKAIREAKRRYTFNLFFPYTHFTFINVHKWKSGAPHSVGSSWQSLEESDKVHGFLMTNDGCVGQQLSDLKMRDLTGPPNPVQLITNALQGFFLYGFNTDWRSGNSRFMKAIGQRLGKTERAFISIMREWESMSEDELKGIDLGAIKGVFKRDPSYYKNFERIF